MRHLELIAVIAAASILCGASSKENTLIPAFVTNKVEIPAWYHEGLYFDGKNIWVNNGFKGNTWVVDPDSGKVIKEITPAGTFTEALTAAEKDIYIVTDWDMRKIYTARIENDKMTAENEISVGPAHPAGAVWTGKDLFVITWARSLSGTRFHLLKMDHRFNLLKDHSIEKIEEPCQLAWDGENLWVSSWYDRRIYKMDPDTLEILGYMKSPVKKTTGLAWDGKYLWVTGTYADLYKMELQNNKYR